MLGALVAIASLAPPTTSLKRPICLYLPLADFDEFTSLTAPAFYYYRDLSVSLSICLSVSVSLSSSVLCWFLMLSIDCQHRGDVDSDPC